MISKEDIIKRFISYVTIDTESDPKSNTTPSTKKQWDLAHLLVEELKCLGKKMLRRWLAISQIFLCPSP